MFYVYAWKRLDTNQYFYIGKGHGRRAFVKSNRNTFFKRIASKYPCEVEFLVDNVTEERAFKLEKDLIWCFRQDGQAYCNLTDGGEGPSGMKHTDEAKSKIRTALLGEKNPNFGCGYKIAGSKNPNFNNGQKICGDKNPSKRPDVRIKLSEINKGHKRNLGKSHSIQTKIKQSEAAKKQSPEKRRKNSIAHSKSVIDLSTGYVWESAKEAASIYGIKEGTLRAMLNGGNPNKTNLRYLNEF